MCGKTSNESILIGKTRKKGKITVCDQCQLYLTPHFNYSWGKYQEKALFFDEARLVDDLGNLTLNRRQDLQSFLTAQNWQKKIDTWNAHNQEQISPDTHVPFYINLLQYRDIACAATQPEREQLGGLVYIVVDDEEARPHFHFRKNDSEGEWAISLTEPKYLKPMPRKLQQGEIDALIAHLQTRSRITSRTRYQSLISLWNDQNCELSTRYQKLNEDRVMPNYLLLADDRERNR